MFTDVTEAYVHSPIYFCLSSIDVKTFHKEEFHGYMHSGFYRDDRIEICGDIWQAGFCPAQEGSALHYTRLGMSF
jgi:hypothetical protein